LQLSNASGANINAAEISAAQAAAAASHGSDYAEMGADGSGQRRGHQSIPNNISGMAHQMQSSTGSTGFAHELQTSAGLSVGSIMSMVQEGGGDAIVGADDELVRPKPGIPHRWWNAAMPIAVVVLSVLLGLILDGYYKIPVEERAEAELKDFFSNSDSFKVLLWASLTGLFFPLFSLRLQVCNIHSLHHTLFSYTLSTLSHIPSHTPSHILSHARPYPGHHVFRRDLRCLVRRS
jgi:hypothetical protein